ncbi:MAG: MBL fold metallo-hydrolase [Candidatus Pacebacteria bacterium]|nr:MBL fold metallo-hydrolase [Candidatus Paceibacterota bacterium]
MMRRFKNNLKFILPSLFFAVAVLVWYAVFCENRKGLEVDFLDVGQGDAIFIQAENGNQVLLDAGEGKAVLRELAEIMPFYDRSIDGLILSHPHSDHLAGFLEVLKRYKVGIVIEPCLETDSPEYKEWLTLVEENKISRVCAKKGETIDIGSGLVLDIILPVGEISGRKEHDAMLAAKLSYGKTSFLFTGDMEKNLENYLASVYKTDLKSNVLKIGHHGSDTSTSEMFLGYVSPEYAVIPVGEKNKYGHPKNVILERLEKFGVKIFRTDQSGLLKFKSDGSRVLLAN